MANLFAKEGEKAILLGNEAIVRGALESGVNFVSTYPGTPASEIGNIFSKIAKQAGVYFEFSTNEKVAVEVGVGASFSGLKTLMAMKNFGLNVALDSLAPFVYTGSKGPAVIVVADDPNCHSSAQSEENTRPMADLIHIPILEPADPQECLDFMKLAFEISEKFQIPIMVRTTTRVAHQSAPVVLGKIASSQPQFSKGRFVRDQRRFVTMPPRVLEMKKELFEKIEKIRDFAEGSPANRLEGQKSEKIGIIASGISYLYVKEALKELELDLPVLKLGNFYPMPVKKIGDFIKGLQKVLVAEELEGFMENSVRGLAKDINPGLEIHGKDLLPVVGELKPEYVVSALAKVVGKEFSVQNPMTNATAIKHLPRFCPGCPYHTVFAAIKKNAPEGTVFGGDIGCYMLGSVAPQSLYDYLFSMGSSLGIGHGIAKATGQKAITFIGDSTFFHAGLPPLINAIFNKSNPIVIILDNGTTAMTGHQPHPGTSVRKEEEYKFEWEGREENSTTPERPISLEEIVKACGVKNLKVVDSFNLKQMEEAVKEFLPKEEVSVIIARGICALLVKKI
ncbi:MAG: indolepyruvate ferredoxin oxidoreductase subunit alpha [Candidatus Nealsonbacteria bacterium]|nr:indolepyruvate ferredoxin oxidoreductase subunit alpha [Candidatus Nealsonbacteria bacterium]